MRLAPHAATPSAPLRHLAATFFVTGRWAEVYCADTRPRHRAPQSGRAGDLRQPLFDVEGVRDRGRGQDRPALCTATIERGGVPERSNGAVLKTAGAVTGARGFESHPRREAPRDPRQTRGRGGARWALSGGNLTGAHALHASSQPQRSQAATTFAYREPAVHGPFGLLRAGPDLPDERTRAPQPGRRRSAGPPALDR